MLPAPATVHTVRNTSGKSSEELASLGSLGYVMSTDRSVRNIYIRSATAEDQRASMAAIEQKQHREAKLIAEMQSLARYSMQK